MTTSVISSRAGSGPFGGTWESVFTGYIADSTGTPTGLIGTASNINLNGSALQAAGVCNIDGTNYLMIGFDSTVDTATFFTQVQVQKLPAGSVQTYLTTAADFYPTGTSTIEGQPIGSDTTAPFWLWPDTALEFTSGSTTNLTWIIPPPIAPQGKGDITDPRAWQDALGNQPPSEFDQVPEDTNYPQNGDGRYWFNVNAFTADSGSPITFIGDPAYYTGIASLQWSVTSTATDGSGAILAYSTDGATWTTATLLPQTQLSGLQNGVVDVNLIGATTFQVQVYAQGGTPSSTAALSQVAVSITRNINETLAWDYPDPFDPIGYNAAYTDNSVQTDTLANLRQRILVRLGFGTSAANPPPGMAALVNDFLQSAQKYLYRRYKQLHTTHMFRWKISPGQRFYSLLDNDENVLSGFNMDPNKTIEWAGIQDSRNVWYPLIQGIPPQLYTMISKPWRPARYEIRQAIEVYPAPDQTYWMWMKGHFGLMSFALDTSSTTLDAELVFLHALANSKAHYGQPDANNIEAQANAYRLELIAGTHQTASYIPGTIAVPPAVRPTLIQYQDNQGG
jgi:hypothetical protein